MPIYGPETWIERNGVVFSHWDRWLLRLAIAERHGLADLIRHLEARRRENRLPTGRDDAEAKLAQLVSLEGRLAALTLEPAELLGQADVADVKVLRRAQEKVFGSGLFYKSVTPAMRDTPRRRLTDRARRGYWSAFPVSPAKFDPELRAIVGKGDFHDWRTTPSLAWSLGDRIERMARAHVPVADKLALYRAAATAIVDGMERVNDSGGEMGELFRDAWKEFVALDWRSTGIAADVYLRDLTEFCAWEDYGLVESLTAPFAGLGAADAIVAERVLMETIAEFRVCGFDYQEERTQRFRVDFLIAQRRYEDFVPTATEFGSHAWMPIVAMARAALAAAERELAKEVFAAADRPGDHQKYLREQSKNLLGESVIAVHLRAVK